MSLYDPNGSCSSVSHFGTGCLGPIWLQDWSDWGVGWNPSGNCPGIPTSWLGSHGLEEIDPAPNVTPLRRNCERLQRFHGHMNIGIALILQRPLYL